MTDKQYIDIVPDPKQRTGISWMLYGHAYHIAQRDLYRQLLRDPETLQRMHAAHNPDFP